MPSTHLLARLLSDLSREPDLDVAMERLGRTALQLTRSRHFMLAVLNEELGSLEVRLALGEDSVKAAGELLPVEMGREDGIMGYVAATGSSVISGDVKRDPHFKRLFETTQSEFAVPVRDRYRRVRAVINLESDRKDAYGGEDREVMTGLAALVSMLLEREAHHQREDALIQVGSSLSAANTEEALVDRVVQVAGDVLRLQACSIFLIDPATDTFIMRGTSGRLREHVGQIAYGRGEGFTGWVCDKAQPILLDNPAIDPRWRGKYVEFPSELVASFLAVPIVSRGRGIGAIRVLRRKSDNPFLDNRFTLDDLALLQAIAEQVAIGLENVRHTQSLIRNERMIAWGELSAKSSHMIGNRVFALKGDINELAHLVGEPTPDLEDIREIQQSLATNVQRIEEILQDFRDFVTATQLNRAPTDLNALVKETVQEVFPRRSDVELELVLDDRIPEVGLDGKRLRRAVSELIENSLNYVDRGRLRVVTRLSGREEHDRTKTSKIEQFAEIDIEDTGPGVEADRKGLIFQPFYSGRVRGMGLGLSIVKGIVDAHGGHVYEAGEEGSGAKFVILLPVTP